MEEKVIRLIVEGFVDAVRKAIEKDRNARYDLNMNWELPPLKWAAWKGEYIDELIHIREADEPGYVIITVYKFKSSKKTNIFDGATLSPDSKEWGVLAAACLHDVIYYVTKRIMEKTGLTEKEIHHFADNSFYSIMVAIGHKKFLARLYLYGIRFGYPLYDKVLRGIVGIGLASFLFFQGCAYLEVPRYGDDGTFLDPNPVLVEPDISPSNLNGD